MLEGDHILFHELSVIDKIIHDETWFEGERRGCYVSPGDPIVRENVCLVILRIGNEMRETAMRKMSERPADEAEKNSPAFHHVAA
jgi:hypothetical protein